METFLLGSILVIILAIGVIPSIYAFVSGAPFVPTNKRAVNKLLELANIKKGQKVYDIGCGDGRMVHYAEKLYGADATGIELSPPIYLLAKLMGFLRKSKAKIVLGDFRKHNLRDADIIVCYMMPAILRKSAEYFERELKRGTRILSYAFSIADWTPIHKEPRQGEFNRAPIWIYEIGNHRGSLLRKSKTPITK